MKLSYVEYKLSILNPVLKKDNFNDVKEKQKVHLGLLFSWQEKDSGMWIDRELHYVGPNSIFNKRGGVISCNIDKYNIESRTRSFDITDRLDITFEDAECLAKKHWNKKLYCLGKSDCWEFVKWFCMQMGLKDELEKADGPLGKGKNPESFGRRARSNRFLRAASTLANLQLVDMVTPSLFSSKKAIKAGKSASDEQKHTEKFEKVNSEILFYLKSTIMRNGIVEIDVSCIDQC